MNNTICDTEINYQLDIVCDIIEDWYSPKSKTLKNDFKGSIKKYHKMDKHKPLYKLFTLCVNLLRERENMMSYKPSNEGKLTQFEADISVMYERYRISDGERLDDMQSTISEYLDEEGDKIDGLLYDLKEQFMKTKEAIGVEVDDPYKDPLVTNPKKLLIYSPQEYKRVITMMKENLTKAQTDQDAFGETWFMNHIKAMERSQELSKFRKVN